MECVCVLPYLFICLAETRRMSNAWLNKKGCNIKKSFSSSFVLAGFEGQCDFTNKCFYENPWQKTKTGSKAQTKQERKESEDFVPYFLLPCPSCDLPTWAFLSESCGQWAGFRVWFFCFQVTKKPLGLSQGQRFSSVQFSRSVLSDSVTPWIATRQASPSITNSWSLLRLMCIELLMPPSHFILWHPLLLLPPIPPSIRVFSNESALCMRWPKYWSFSFSINPSNEHPGLISFRMDWLDLLADQGTLKSLLQHHSVP